jgi:hypothetical protein
MNLKTSRGRSGWSAHSYLSVAPCSDKFSPLPPFVALFLCSAFCSCYLPKSFPIFQTEPNLSLLHRNHNLIIAPQKTKLPKPLLTQQSNVLIPISHTLCLRGLCPSFHIKNLTWTTFEGRRTNKQQALLALQLKKTPFTSYCSFPLRHHDAGYCSLGDDTPSGHSTTLSSRWICTPPHRRVHYTLVVYVSARQDRCV